MMSSPFVQREPLKVERDTNDIAKLYDNIPELRKRYDILRHVGHGTFSRVYIARLKSPGKTNANTDYAIKHIVPTSHPSRVRMELHCLMKLGGSRNIIEVFDCLRHFNHIVLVMPYFPHDSTSDYIGCLNTDELRHYMRNLLLALEYVHQNKILHRDVKPANFLYHRSSRQYRLVDFGLAQFFETDFLTECFKRTPLARPGTPLPSTPHLQSGRPVKRKLPVDTPSMEECCRINKRPRASAADGDFTGALTSAASRLNTRLPHLNTELRRSSRKHLEKSPVKKENANLSANSFQSQALLHATPPKKGNEGKTGPKTPPKETVAFSPAPETTKSVTPNMCNIRATPMKGPIQNESSVKVNAGKVENRASGVTPRKNTTRDALKQQTALLDSPSKHTRQAEAARRREENRQTLHHQQPTDSMAPSSSRLVSLTKVSDLYARFDPTATAGVATTGAVCRCYGRGQVCKKCEEKPAQAAPRAGTPGFRPPEVLLRHPQQGTGVDIWACGIVAVCLASGRYPFFRAPDDQMALAELCSIFSTKAVRKTAATLDKLFLCNVDRPPLDLQKICEALRRPLCSENANISGKSCERCLQSRICVCKVTAELSNITLSKNESDETDSTLEDKVQSKIDPLSDYLKKLFEQRHSVTVTRLGVCSPSKVKSKLPLAAKDMKEEVATAVTPLCKTTDDKPIAALENFIPLPVEMKKRRKRPPLFPEAYPQVFYDLIEKLLDVNPKTRVSATEALKHAFFNEESNP